MAFFVSYAHVDEIIVSQLATVMRTAGLEAWWDDRLEPGDDWKRALRQRIAASDGFICVISDDAIESEWCQWELSQAAALNKVLVPILVRPTNQLPHALAALQHLDVTAGLDVSSVARLIGKLTRLGQKADPASVHASRQPQGLPARFRQPLPKAYRTIAQGYLQPRAPGMQMHQWGPVTQKPQRGQWIVGIDFGTTTSSIGIHKTSGVELIPNDLGHTSTPSAVAIAEDGTPLVGQRALDLLLLKPARGVLEVKRLFGREMYREYGAEPVLEVDGIAYSATDLAAFVIQQLKRDAEAYLGAPISPAVLAMPAYFDASQCAALTCAATYAGLNVLRVLTEPVAACLVLPHVLRNANTLVYDLGAGTFDVSVVSRGEGVVEVMSINGDTALGGADFDRVAVDYCLEQFKDATGVDLAGDAIALMRIRDAVERAKIALSSARMVTVDVPYVAFTNDGPLHLSLPLSRIRYNELTHELVARTIALTRRALDDGGLAAAQLDEVLIVGRAARAASVRAALEDFFPCPIRTAPDEVVATGAALNGGTLAGTFRTILLLDGVTRTIRLHVAGDRALLILRRHTAIPTRASVQLRLQRPGARTVLIRLLSGESSRASETPLLVEFEATVPGQTLDFELSVDIDANSFVNVDFTGSGRIGSVGLRQTNSLPPEPQPFSESKRGLLPLATEVLKLPPFAVELVKDRAATRRWLTAALVDFLAARGDSRVTGDMQKRVRTDPQYEPDLGPLEGMLREELVDALEERFSVPLTPLRYMRSAESMACALQGTLDGRP